MAEQSRNEEILRSIIDETEYNKTPQSREEELLLELKQAIEDGGSSVVPNPEGEATETLNKLGIDDTVYGFPSGGGALSKYTIEFSGGNYGNLGDNKTFGDIKSDYLSGKIPYIVDTFNQIYHLVSAVRDYIFAKYGFDPYTGNLQVIFLTFSGADTVKKPSKSAFVYARA